MNLPRIFYDPENPVSRFVWGVEPGHERFRRKARNEFRLPFLVIALPHAITLGTSLINWRLHGVFKLLEFVPMGIGIGWMMLVLVMFGAFAETNAPRDPRGTAWRDLRLAGLTGREILGGIAGPSLCGVALAILIQSICSILLIAVDALRGLQRGPPSFVTGSSFSFHVDVALRSVALVLGLAFILLSTLLLDMGLWVRHPGLLPRIAAWAGLMMMSPLVWAFAPAFMGGLPFGLPLSVFAMLEYLSWPVRGWIVWRVWQSAIRTLDEDDVP